MMRLLLCLPRYLLSTPESLAKATRPVRATSRMPVKRPEHTLQPQKACSSVSTTAGEVIRQSPYNANFRSISEVVQVSSCAMLTSPVPCEEGLLQLMGCRHIGEVKP